MYHKRHGWSVLLLLAAAMLLLPACKRDAGVPSWDAEALLPLVSDSLSLNNLVADSLLEANADGSLRLVYANRLLGLDLVDEGIEIPDTALTVSVNLETLVLDDRSIETRISLGRLLQEVPGGALLILLINTGSPVSVPAVADIGTGAVPIDATDFFISADIDSGYLDIEVANGLALDLTDALFVLRDPVGGFEVLRDSFDLIPAGGTVGSSVDLSGLTVGGLLEAELVRVSTPGTTSAVAMDTADAVLVTASVRGMKVNEATAIFPAQDLVNTESNVLYDLGGPEVTSMDIASGNVLIQVVNTIGDSISIDYAIPGATGPDGLPVAFQAVVPPAPLGGSIFIEERFDLTGYSIDLRGPSGNAFNTFGNQFSARIDSTGTVVTISLDDSIRVNYGLESIVPAALYGYAGQAEFDLDESVSFDFLEGISADVLDMAETDLDLVIRNGQGVEGRIVLDAFQAENSRTATTVDLIAPSLIGQPVDVVRAVRNPFVPGITRIALDENNSNVDALLEALPDRLSASGQVMVNPNGNTFGYQDFVVASNALDLDAELSIPLRIAAQGLSVADTLSFELFSGAEDPTVAVLSATLYLKARNAFPMNGSLRVEFLDNAGVLQYTLFASPLALPEGLVGPDCRVSVPGQLDLEIPLDAEAVNALRSATQVRTAAVLNTADAPDCGGYATLFADQYLAFELAAALELAVVADF